MKCKDCEYCIPIEEAPNVELFMEASVAICKKSFEKKQAYEIVAETRDHSCLTNCFFGDDPDMFKLFGDDFGTLD
jgi:hypothetical protein